MAAFVDTNILLYAYSSVNEGETEKVEVPKRLIDRLTEDDALILSAQVLSEFVWIGGKKGKKPPTTVELALIVNDLCRQTVVSIDAPLVHLALQRTRSSRISYRDALIVEAAIRSGATTLYTQDMYHGTRYGGLQLINPFTS